ncbi:DinB family protein [Aequorivita echinoideorum]|uniref:DinB family protein n=1 Tax=Aequorivita echinoideorum TaxID=1549647 RepID=A0ABS5S4R5_9FLAO|nr:DinB family protein [Aequorivita echinoideorum]MBT0608212.1 DinB family protein [Aequorivita echinoideorum]
MSENKLIRERLAKHLEGGEAFLPVDKMLDEISFSEINKRPKNLPYSFYELFYHITFAQKDILDFCVSEKYSEHNWPEDYWSENKECKTEKDWENLKADYFETRKELKDFLLNFENGLTSPVKNGTNEQTLLREIILVIEHTAYHTGQMLIILRLLNLH